MTVLELILATIAGVGAQGIRVGGGTLFVTTASGAPARLTIANAFVALSLIFTGHTGSVQSGDIVLQYVPAQSLGTPPPSPIVNQSNVAPEPHAAG